MCQIRSEADTRFFVTGAEIRVCCVGVMVSQVHNNAISQVHTRGALLGGGYEYTIRHTRYKQKHMHTAYSRSLSLSLSLSLSFSLSFSLTHTLSHTHTLSLSLFLSLALSSSLSLQARHTFRNTTFYGYVVKVAMV